ncbi:MAG: hypothetical protein LBB88_08255 [Planctomycetaceae bacterium]|jgi:hypothetical protein|nr:hypothetical protein [Planctomycetaceae bacterium]
MRSVVKMQKIYFDTSAICSLFDNSSNTYVVISLFEFLSKNSSKFRLFISPIFHYEIDFASQSLNNKVADVISQFKIISLPNSFNEIAELLKLYIKQHVLTEKHLEDLAHIAYASIFSCDYLISCDTKHIVRKKTIELVTNINTPQNIFVPKIVTPFKFMEIFK